MAIKNEITITLDEYKELLLKYKPNDKDAMLLDRIKTLIFDNITYYENWDKEVQIDFKSDSKFTEELLTTIKILDKELYKEMIKHICDEKAQKDAEKAQMKKARAIKDIDKK